MARTKGVPETSPRQPGGGRKPGVAEAQPRKPGGGRPRINEASATAKTIGVSNSDDYHFVAGLAKRNGWTLAHALAQIIDYYRRNSEIPSVTATEAPAEVD